MQNNEMKTHVKDMLISELRPYKNNARIHDEEQIETIMKSIEEFGYIAPVIVDENNMILVGHGRAEAVKRLGIEKIPCVCVEGLDDEHKRAYILSDNLLTERGGWDLDILQNEVEDIEMDMTDFGFEEIEKSLDDMSFEDEEEELVTCPKCGYEFNPAGGEDGE